MEADRIQAAKSYVPSMIELETAALLAQEEYLTSMKFITIKDKNTIDIPSDQMHKLASIVTRKVLIDNMAPASRVSGILANVQCPWIELCYMELKKEETQALVTAMRVRVQRVELVEDVTLNIEEFTQYDGQRCCRRLVFEGDTRRRYGERLRGWAAVRGWTVTVDKGWDLIQLDPIGLGSLEIERK